MERFFTLKHDIFIIKKLFYSTHQVSCYRFFIVESVNLIIVPTKNSGLESREGTCICKIWSSREQTECKNLFTFPCVASYLQLKKHFKIFIKNNNFFIISGN